MRRDWHPSSHWELIANRLPELIYLILLILCSIVLPTLPRLRRHTIATTILGLGIANPYSSHLLEHCQAAGVL